MGLVRRDSNQSPKPVPGYEDLEIQAISDGTALVTVAPEYRIYHNMHIIACYDARLYKHTKSASGIDVGYIQRAGVIVFLDYREGIVEVAPSYSAADLVLSPNHTEVPKYTFGWKIPVGPADYRKLSETKKWSSYRFSCHENPDYYFEGTLDERAVLELKKRIALGLHDLTRHRVKGSVEDLL